MMRFLLCMLRYLFFPVRMGQSAVLASPKIMSQDSRCRGMEGLDDDAVQCAQTGKLLGRLVRDHFAPTYDAFVAMVVNPPHPLLNVVVHVAYTRSPLRLRGGDSLLAELQRTPRRRHMDHLLRDAWAAYRTLRHHAAPLAAHPVVTPEDVPLEMTRAVSNFLAPSGIHPQHRDWRRDARQARADERMRELWADMDGRGCVMWFDNFWKRLLTSNPAHPLRTYNCTVMAVMRVRSLRLPDYPGYPTVEQLLQRLPAVAAALADAAAHRVAALVADVAAVPLRPHEFRVPLDVPRPAARSPVWRPFSVSDDVVSAQVGLLRVLRFLRDVVGARVHPPLPLLVDTNLWYRQLKLVYGREAQRWDGAAALATVPPLYGVWHPYKQVLQVLYRRLLPLFLYVQKGTLAAGVEWSEKPKLRALEQWIGALLMVPADRRVRVCAHRDHLRRRRAILEAEVARWDGRVAEAERQLEASAARAARQLQRSFQGRGDLQAGLQTGSEATRNQQAREEALRRRAAAAEALRLCRLDAAVAEALCDLLVVWAPACFALGWRVRQCHWEHREAGTGHHAREVLTMALLMLLHLEAPAPGVRNRGRSEYVRTLSCALLLWEGWFDRLPACCFSEEINEASLSRLGSAMRQHPDATTTPAVMDLFLLVRPGRKGFRKIAPGGVDAGWYRLCLEHLDHLLDVCSLRNPPGPQRRLLSDVVTYVARRPEAAARDQGVLDRDEDEGPAEEQATEPRWPADWTPPPPLTDVAAGPKSLGDMEEVLRYALRTLLRDDPNPRDAVVAEMDALCPRRDPDDVAAIQRVWDVTTGYRPPKPGPRPKPKAIGRLRNRGDAVNQMYGGRCFLKCHVNYERLNIGVINFFSLSVRNCPRLVGEIVKEACPLIWILNDDV